MRSTQRKGVDVRYRENKFLPDRLNDPVSLSELKSEKKTTLASPNWPSPEILYINGDKKRFRVRHACAIFSQKGHGQNHPEKPAIDGWPLLKLRQRAGIFKQSMGARNRVGIEISYRPTRLHRLAEFIPWHRFLGSINV